VIPKQFIYAMSFARSLERLSSSNNYYRQYGAVSWRGRKPQPLVVPPM